MDCKVKHLIFQKRKGKRARTVSSVLSAKKTIRRRLATTLGIMDKPNVEIPLFVPVMRKIPNSQRSVLNNARYNAGIPQVSLFGNGLGLNYSPPE